MKYSSDSRCASVRRRGDHVERLLNYTLFIVHICIKVVTINHFIDDAVRPLAENVTLKVNNSLARVRASMLDRSPSRIQGFYTEYENSFYGPMAIANSRVTVSHIGEALRGLLEMQIRHPEVMSADDSLMGRNFYTAISVLAEAKDIGFKINLARIVSKVKGSDPEWPCLSWEKARRILIPVYTDRR
ncbi:uncharacterized protein LOC142519352 [Primulina tabacum]|uniref:uncharacterized protein LOC142519352 n=1 Tax=Primulina tabacum TaxID=48773 RepID=UPI003F59E0FE